MTTVSSCETAIEIEGVVLEVFPAFGMAHFRTPHGAIYGLNRTTPGVDFDSLREGQHLRCEVTNKFHRVVHATLVG
jgi:hypothetical protein